MAALTVQMCLRYHMSLTASDSESYHVIFLSVEGIKGRDHLEGAVSLRRTSGFGAQLSRYGNPRDQGMRWQLRSFRRDPTLGSAPDRT